MKLEVGKAYRSEAGDKINIVYHNEDLIGENTYLGVVEGKDGVTIWLTVNGEHNYPDESCNIVEEWNAWHEIEPDTFPPVRPSQYVDVIYDNTGLAESGRADSFSWNSEGEARITSWRISIG